MVFQSYSLFPQPERRATTWPSGCGCARCAAGRARRKRAGELLELVGLADARRAVPAPAVRRPAAARRAGPGAGAASRACCCSTSRCRRWTPRCACSCARRSGGSSRSSASPPSSSPTTRRRRCRWPTGSRCMRGGRLEQCAAPAELYDRPATPFVAEFVGTMNHLPGRAVRATRSTVARPAAAGGRRRSPPAAEVDVLVRPEAVLVTPSSEGSAMIVASSFRGSSARLRVRAGRAGGPLRRARPRSDAAGPRHAGEGQPRAASRPGRRTHRRRPRRSGVRQVGEPRRCQLSSGPSCSTWTAHSWTPRECGGKRARRWRRSSAWS